MQKALLSSTYFGPVQWYQKLYRYGKLYVEAYDSFTKQTYRNRCVIATTSGTQALTVPVERPVTTVCSDETATFGKCLMKDVRISDHGNWRHLHWNALASAYGESPFFEFYADEFAAAFMGREKAMAALTEMKQFFDRTGILFKELADSFDCRIDHLRSAVLPDPTGIQVRQMSDLEVIESLQGAN